MTGRLEITFRTGIQYEKHRSAGHVRTETPLLFRVAAGGCLTLDWPEKSTFAITRISSDIGLSDFTETVTP